MPSIWGTTYAAICSLSPFGKRKRDERGDPTAPAAEGNTAMSQNPPGIAAEVGQPIDKTGGDVEALFHYQQSSREQGEAARGNSIPLHTGISRVERAQHASATTSLGQRLEARKVARGLAAPTGSSSHAAALVLSKMTAPTTAVAAGQGTIPLSCTVSQNADLPAPSLNATHHRQAASSGLSFALRASADIPVSEVQPKRLMFSTAADQNPSAVMPPQPGPISASILPHQWMSIPTSINRATHPATPPPTRQLNYSQALHTGLQTQPVQQQRKEHGYRQDASIAQQRQRTQTLPLSALDQKEQEQTQRQHPSQISQQQPTWGASMQAQAQPWQHQSGPTYAGTRQQDPDRNRQQQHPQQQQQQQGSHSRTDRQQARPHSARWNGYQPPQHPRPATAAELKELQREHSAEHERNVQARLREPKLKAHELVDFTTMFEGIDLEDSDRRQRLHDLERNLQQSRMVSSSGPVRARQAAQQQQGTQAQGMRSDDASRPPTAADMEAIADRSRNSYSDARTQQGLLQAQMGNNHGPTSRQPNGCHPPAAAQQRPQQPIPAHSPAAHPPPAPAPAPAQRLQQLALGRHITHTFSSLAQPPHTDLSKQSNHQHQAQPQLPPQHQAPQQRQRQAQQQPPARPAPSAQLASLSLRSPAALRVHARMASTQQEAEQIRRESKQRVDLILSPALAVPQAEAEEAEEVVLLEDSEPELIEDDMGEMDEGEQEEAEVGEGEGEELEDEGAEGEDEEADAEAGEDDAGDWAVAGEGGVGMPGEGRRGLSGVQKAFVATVMDRTELTSEVRTSTVRFANRLGIPPSAKGVGGGGQPPAPVQGIRLDTASVGRCPDSPAPDKDVARHLRKYAKPPTPTPEARYDFVTHIPCFPPFSPAQVLARHIGSKLDLPRGKLQCMKRGQWLNDEVINVYMLMLQERDGRLRGSAPLATAPPPASSSSSRRSPAPSGAPLTLPRCHFFSSFFYNKLYKDLNTYTYANVKRWTTPKKLETAGQGCKCLLDVDRIIMPIHCGMHWTCAVVDIKNESIYYYDSLMGEDATLLANLARWVADEALDKQGRALDTSRWTLHHPKHIPRQRNGCDCGVFAITYANYLGLARPFDFRQEVRARARRRAPPPAWRLRWGAGRPGRCAASVPSCAASSHGALPPLALNPPPQLLTLTCAQPPAARICAELGTTRHWQVSPGLDRRFPVHHPPSHAPQHLPDMEYFRGKVLSQLQASMVE
ncbi:MAG: hypothetical protein WDW38_000074 [Sanguina aurantia]